MESLELDNPRLKTTPNLLKTNVNVMIEIMLSMSKDVNKFFVIYSIIGTLCQPLGAKGIFTPKTFQNCMF